MSEETLKEQLRLLDLLHQYRSGREISDIAAIEEKFCNDLGTLDEDELCVLKEAIAKIPEVTGK